MILYYNPECSKCNQALNIFKESNCKFEIKNYLLEPPSAEELRRLIKLIGCSAIDITRQKEKIFQEKYANLDLSETELLSILSCNPILIERPIVIDGTCAIIGRPVERIFDLIKSK